MYLFTLFFNSPVGTEGGGLSPECVLRIHSVSLKVIKWDGFSE